MTVDEVSPASAVTNFDYLGWLRRTTENWRMGFVLDKDPMPNEKSEDVPISN